MKNFDNSSGVPTEQFVLREIHLYQGTFNANINTQELCIYLQNLLPGISIYVHKEFIQHYVLKTSAVETADCLENLAAAFAGIKILDPRIKERPTKPLYGEIEYETRRLLNTFRQPSGILYDGEKFLAICNRLLPEKDRGSHVLHVVLTNQLIATWNHDDLQFHMRTSVYGIPSLISTRGLVEAPARPRHYYLSLQMGLPQETLEKKLSSQFLAHEDSRMTEVMKGYVLQALFYHVTGNPFCTDPGCRLFNAHWQQELLYAQLESPYEFCVTHQLFIDTLRTMNW